MLSSKLLDKYIPKNAKIGEAKRFNHDECGDKRGRLYVTKTEAGYLYHCHNCAPKMSGIHKTKTGPSPSDTLAIYEKLEQNQAFTEGECVLPLDFINRIPETGSNWLNKYDLTPFELLVYNFGYSALYDRLVLPVYDSAGELVAWQGRYLGDEDKPKYITYKKPGERVFFDSSNGWESSWPYPNEDVVCIVEDIVSAIKVGRYCKTIALLGSHIPDALMAQMIGKKCYIWLDEDKHQEAHEFRQRMTGLGVNSVVISTINDPKECDDSWIKEIIT